MQISLSGFELLSDMFKTDVHIYTIRRPVNRRIKRGRGVLIPNCLCFMNILLKIVFEYLGDFVLSDNLCVTSVVSSLGNVI